MGPREVSNEICKLYMQDFKEKIKSIDDIFKLCFVINVLNYKTYAIAPSVVFGRWTIHAASLEHSFWWLDCVLRGTIGGFFCCGISRLGNLTGMSGMWNFPAYNRA